MVKLKTNKTNKTNMINLNDDTFSGNANVAIFNNGETGIVEGVKIAVNKKGKDDKENAPNYKIEFTDTNGASTNMAFWIVTDATEYATVEQQIKKQGKVLKHIIHAIYGADYEFPQYPNPTTMLDGVMKLIKEATSTNTYRVFTNYGSTMGVKAYIQVRSWVPFMEPSNVAIADTRLTRGNIDAMERLVEDTVTSNSVATADAGDDW